MFPFLYFLTQNKFPVNVPIERDVNLPWSQITFPIAGDLKLPWSTVEFMPVENRMPLSGAVDQDISDDWDTTGDAGLGADLVKEAGPVSLQLSTTMHAMEQMCEALPQELQDKLSPEKNQAMANFKKLLDIHKRVHADHKDRHLAQTRRDIEDLIRRDPDAATQLLSSFMQQLNGSKAVAGKETTPLSLPAPKS